MSVKTPEFICLHHTAVSHAKNKDQFKVNNKYHQSKHFPVSSMGFYLGYNYEVSARGKIYQAREEGEVTAACPQEGMNSGKCIHIALDGHFDIEKPTDKQIYALRDLLRNLVAKYGIKRENLVYHRDYAPKSCPGNYLEGDRQFRKSLAWKEEDEQDEKVLNLKKEIFNKIRELQNLIYKIFLSK